MRSYVAGASRVKAPLASVFAVLAEPSTRTVASTSGAPTLSTTTPSIVEAEGASPPPSVPPLLEPPDDELELAPPSEVGVPPITGSSPTQAT